ncbi:hypothetical protein [Herbidospora cretacea]|nr:hypothetical protein [Herbidospora cretacea]
MEQDLALTRQQAAGHASELEDQLARQREAADQTVRKQGSYLP